MPDANKFAKLREIGYGVRGCCALCVDRQFKSGSDWGTCRRHEYEHLKHSGPARGTSIHKLGRCSSFKLDESAAAQALGAHREFMEKA